MAAVPMSENVELEPVKVTETLETTELIETKTNEKKHRKWPFGGGKKEKTTTVATQPIDPLAPTMLTMEPCKENKCKWWPEMSIGLNMLDRDEKGMAQHVALSFEDVFAEPDQTQSWDCVWRLTHRLFTATRLFMYRLLTLIIVVPVALIFALLFALAAVLNNFICVPGARFLAIPLTWLAKAWNFLVRSIFDPLFRSLSLCFSGMSIRRHGISSDPTADVL